MVNEILQWAVLAVFGLLMLGVLRQVSVLSPTPADASIGGPDVSSAVPRELATRVGSLVSPSSGGAIVAFVTEDCVACHRLISDLAEGRQTLNGIPLVLVADRPSEQFVQAVRDAELPFIADTTGALWGACNVSATPLLIRIDEQGNTAQKEVSHRVDSVA